VLRTGMGWCGQCFAPVDGPAFPARPVAAEQVVIPTYTRWRKTATKFGPFGRVSWTLGVLAGLALCLFSRDPFALVAMVIVGGVVLRSVWGRSRLS
jgi:hypothetical protein